VKTVQIGGETIKDAELGVVDVQGQIEPTCCWARTSCAPTACCSR
jgi:hypothetical protein